MGTVKKTVLPTVSDVLVNLLDIFNDINKLSEEINIRHVSSQHVGIFDNLQISMGT